MSNPVAADHPLSRNEAVEVVADKLLQRASLITRLLLRSSESELSRAETGILGALQLDGSQRVTALAAGQALAQPTVTQLVALLEQRGLVTRGRDPLDGRAVVVSITAVGDASLEAIRSGYRGLLREQLADRSDADLLALAAATDVLQDLIDALIGELDQ